MMAILGRMLLAALIAVVSLIGGGCSHAPYFACEQVVEIQSIPMKGQGSDEAYLALMAAGEAAVPCLIGKISDTTPMPDPRMAPQFHGTVVGDVAIFMLVRITGIEFPELLPEEVKESYGVKGVYAYFDYVAEPAHRRDLQERWRDWWKQHN